jgi:hypothetical protein
MTGGKGPQHTHMQSQTQKNRKGQMAGLSNSIVQLGVAAIVLVIILVILAGFRDSDILAPNTGVVNNESSNTVRASINASGYALAQNGLQGFNPTIIIVHNTTSAGALGFVIPATNYTYNAVTRTIGNATATTYNFVNITYSYRYGDESYTTTNKTFTGIGKFADFWTIIVLAIVAALVLSIIFGLFGRTGTR